MIDFSNVFEVVVLGMWVQFMCLCYVLENIVNMDMFGYC